MDDHLVRLWCTCLWLTLDLVYARLFILPAASPYDYCIKILSVFFASVYGVLSLLPHCCFGLISCIVGLFVGVLIVYCVICGLLGLYSYFKANSRFAVYWTKYARYPLFSPIFTLLVKPLVPLLAFDPTGMLFLIIAVSLAVEVVWS